MKRNISLENESYPNGEVSCSKKVKQLSGVIFRNMFIKEPTAALRYFLEIFRDKSSEQDIVKEYLESGGNGEEIVLMLSLENIDHETIILIFTVLECIFVRIVTDLTFYLPNAEETAKCLLQSHLSSVYSLLSAQSSHECKKVVLRFLTVMSTMSAKVAKYMLAHLKLSPNMQFGFAKNDNPNRVLFIHFVLSFIVDGDPQVIKLLLDKKEFLRCIIPGLVCDSAETVGMVLSILQNHILENPVLSKTTKMHTFNSNILKSLFALFNWKGPQKALKKKSSKNLSEPSVSEVDPEAKAEVQEALLPFLSVLCGSPKFGVVFFDPQLGFSGKNHNLLVYKVLENLEKPWEQNILVKLLLNIFSACPDLIHPTILRMVPFLEPRVSSKWFDAMDFIGKIIDSASPCVYLSKPGSLAHKQLLQALEQILMPRAVMQLLVGSSAKGMGGAADGVAMMHSDILVRHVAVSIISKMVKAMSAFMDFEGLEKYFSSQSSAEKFRYSMIEQMSKVLPNVGCILQVWKKGVQDIKDEKGMHSDALHFNDSDHMKTILSLLLTYSKWWPPLELSAGIGDLEDGWGLLSPSSFLSEAQKFDGLELMALELLCTTGSLTISHDQGTQEILKHMIHSFVRQVKKKHYQPWKQLILTTFLKTGFFEGNEIEACVWVSCFHNWFHAKSKNSCHSEEEYNALADFIVASLNSLITSTEHYLRIISCVFERAYSADGISRGESKHDNLLQILSAMMEPDFDPDKHVGDESRQISVPSISPLLPAALIEAKNYPIGTENGDLINGYLKLVMVHILFGQESPRPLQYLFKEVSSYSPPKSLEKYLKSWSTQTPQRVGQLLSDDNIFSHLSDALLDGKKYVEKTSWDSLLSAGGINDGVDVVLLSQLLFFHIVSLAQQGCLSKHVMSFAKCVLDHLVHNPNLSQERENLFLQKSNCRFKSLTCLCLLPVLSNSVVLELFEPLGGSDKPQRLVTQLVLHVMCLVGSCKEDLIDSMCHRFKEKFRQRIYDSLAGLSDGKEMERKWDKAMIESLLESFLFAPENLMHFLEKFKAIPSRSLVEITSWNLSGPGFLLVTSLHQICKLKVAGTKFTIESEVFCFVIDHLLCLEELFESTSTDGLGDALSQLEECIVEVLTIFPQLTGVLPPRLLQHFLSSKFTRESANKLVHLMICHDEAFASLALEQCDTSWSTVCLHFERILSCLTCILEMGKHSIPDTILSDIYEEKKDSVMDIFNDSSGMPLWIENNPQLFQLIVQRVMDADMVSALLNIVSSKFDGRADIKFSFMDIVYSLFKKAEEFSAIKSKPSFLQILLQMYVSKLKNAEENQNSSVDAEEEMSQVEVDNYAKFICDLVEKDEKCDSYSFLNSEWRSLKNQCIWKEFSQLAVKIGLSENNDTVLKCLVKLCSKVLSKGDAEAAFLCKISILHSKFLDVMLEGKSCKGTILELLVSLNEKNPAGLTFSVVPLLLSSYGATLGKCDSLILKLLRMLDQDDVNFIQFSPFLWGEMAASFYSLKSKSKSAAFSAFSVLRQPKADQVLDLIEIHLVENTITNFPIQRKLQPEDALQIEYTNANVYDPCFYLPLLSHILAPENPVKTYKVVRSGALALVVSALQSSDEEVRGAAMHILARFYCHLETGQRSKEKKLWMNFIDSLRNGFGLLFDSKDMNSVSGLQLPPVVAVFLSRASLVMSDPQHVMFFPVNNYFLAKPALNLEMVPEFFRLYNSVELDARSHRHWILEILRDGIKTGLDFIVCLNNGTFKVLMVSFCSGLCDEKSKELILEILSDAVKTPSTAYYLVKGHGLISWLQNVIRFLPVPASKGSHFIVIEVVRLLHSLWFTLCYGDGGKSRIDCNEKTSSFLSITSNSMISLLLSLLPKLFFAGLKMTDFFQYIMLLYCVTQVYHKNQKVTNMIQKEDVESVILLGKNILGNVNICYDALEYGCCVFPTNNELYKSFDDSSLEALKCLFKFVISWKHKDSPEESL